MTDTKNSNQEALSVIVLAAGKGTRMKSPLPKVLHPVAGRPMIEKVILASREAGAQNIRIVVGHGQALVRQVVEPMKVTCYVQENQLGTADAVRSAKPEEMDGFVVIMNGDHPLIEASDIKNFVAEFKDLKCDVAVVTAVLKQPGEFGRIVRHKGDLAAIVEAKDASASTLAINEVNTGIYIAKCEALAQLLPMVGNNNSKKEFYLTDIISIGLSEKMKVSAIKTTPKVALGVNTQQELAVATRQIFKRKAQALMEAGVLLIDPKTTYIEESVHVGPGTVIYPNVFLRGRTAVGSFCVLESNVFISESIIKDSVQIRGGSYLEGAVVDNKASLGPYARLRPETHIQEEAHVGNFVEMKKTVFGKKSKAGHLSYLGDAVVGENVNIGCGTITCNYAVDKKKYQTVIGNNVFVGSDSQFVAPVVIGDNAIIASGSTITEEVPANALGIARGRQVNKEDYATELAEKNSEKEY